MPSGHLSKKRGGTGEGGGEEEGVGPRWGCLTMDRPTRFVVAWAFAPSEDEAAPAVVRRTRERTEGRRGVPWIGDGRAVYRREVRRVYHDPVRTGKRGRPPLKPTPGVGAYPGGEAPPQREGSEG